MLRPRDAFVCSLLVLGGASMVAPPSAASADALGETGSSDARAMQSGRKLTGRFLHITDFHPDPFYKTYSSTIAEAACHRHRGPAGVYGAETSGCDSPFSLINETFRWINDNVKDEIDFVIWTGDSARHDNDEKHVRTQKQIISQNEFLVDKFGEVFGVPDKDRRGINDYVIPIVPTFGNNDIMPHNIFLSGPNKWTMKYLDIWRSFIPEAQRHQFQQGGWFSVEVIPGKLAVISLNTIYFFTSNSGVDGCANKHEPGYEHMDWLRIQLKIMRDRGMKAILMGHVPPARVDGKESWDETCWQKYTLWVQQYRDVIVGSLYGHMNIDHFMLQDFEQIEDHTKKGDMAARARAKTTAGEIRLLEDGEITVASASDYLLSLRKFWARLPSPLAGSDRKSRVKSEFWDDEEETNESSTWEWLMFKISGSQARRKTGKSTKNKYLEKIGGKYAQRYSASLVSPSVVPNYFPTLRIVEYNITGLEHLHIHGSSSPDVPDDQQPSIKHEFSDDEGYKREIETQVKRKEKQKEKEKVAKRSKKYRFKVPEGPSKSAPPGPAYSPQVFTWVRYTQYFANLTRINNDFVDPLHHQLDVDSEFSSTNDLAPRQIFGLQVSNGKIESKGWKEGKHGKHQGKKPRPEPHPTEFTYEVEYDTKEKRFPDLTVRRWVEYARKIGGSGAKAAEIIDYEEADELEQDLGEQQDELEAEGKKHKKHKKGKKHRKASKEWFTFVRRAFVSTMDPREIKEVFGQAAPALEEVQEDIMEL